MSAFSAKAEEVALMLDGYRDDGRVIVHGDLYLGNTVATNEETWLIDLDMVSYGPMLGDGCARFGERHGDAERWRLVSER